MADLPQSAPRTTYTSPEEPKASLASNILAIVGFIILIVVVIWGLVHLASISRGWFSSLFGGSNSVITVSAPANAVSGTPFTVSWKYSEPTSGTYALLYQCEDGLQFLTPSPEGNVMNGIPCGAAFTVPSKDKSISVTPFLPGTASLDVPISIIFMPSASGTRAQGSATVKISPATTPSPAPTPAAPTPASSTGSGQATPAPTYKTPAKSGPADLSVRITSVSTDGWGNGSATFDISNVGGSASGTYYFTAELPTMSGYTYTSPAQASLAPGAHILDTLHFSQADGGIFSVSITTPDGNSANNYASQPMNVGYGGTYLPTGQAGNYTYPYQSQYSAAAYPSYPSYAPSYPVAQPYQTQMYPSMYQQPYNTMYQYPYQQQYPYSMYYPYIY